MENNDNSNCSSAGTDRKSAERNRRNQMKSLYSKLDSLVPHQTPREATSLPDQIEEATNYIKKLEEDLEKLKEERDELMEMDKASPDLKPQVEVQEVGSAVEVVLVTGLDYHSIFQQSIRLIQEEGAVVVNVTQSMFPDRALHTILAEVAGDELAAAGTNAAARISERLKELFAI